MKSIKRIHYITAIPPQPMGRFGIGTAHGTTSKLPEQYEHRKQEYEILLRELEISVYE